MKKWQPEELEEIACDFCGSHEVCAEHVRGDSMRVVECGVCGLAYVNPRPPVNLIPRFYEEDYFTGAAAERGEGGLRLDLDTTADAGRQSDGKGTPRPIELMNDKFGGLHNKNLLEIGCATGELLLKVSKAGARAKGLEISDFAAEIARKRGLAVATGTVEDYVARTYDTFDVVMAFEVIEHVTSPTRFFINAAKLVRPNGLLMLSTPNYACVNRFGDKWLGFTSSFEHLYFYTADILKRFAFRSNFTLEYWETSLNDGGMFEQHNFLKRQLKRLNTATRLMQEHGINRTAAIRVSKSPGYVSYDTGHTLLTVLRKI